MYRDLRLIRRFKGSSTSTIKLSLWARSLSWLTLCWYQFFLCPHLWLSRTLSIKTSGSCVALTSTGLPRSGQIPPVQNSSGDVSGVFNQIASSDWSASSTHTVKKLSPHHIQAKSWEVRTLERKRGQKRRHAVCGDSEWKRSVTLTHTHAHNEILTGSFFLSSAQFTSIPFSGLYRHGRYLVTLLPRHHQK